MGDKELAAIGVRSGIGHRKDARAVMFEGVIKFIIELVAGSAHAGSGRVAALHHEITDHTVEDGVVVKSLASQENQVIDGSRCFAGI